MIKQKKAVLEEKLKRNDLGTGMAYQRGIDVATRCFRQGLPILLKDQELNDLKTCAHLLREQQLDANTYFGASRVLISDYVAKLLNVYLDPNTMRNGLQVLEKIHGSLDGSDLYDNPYADQIERCYGGRKNDKR